MTDYRSMFDRDYIGAWDLPHDVTVTIAKVEAKKIRNKSAWCRSRQWRIFVINGRKPKHG